MILTTTNITKHFRSTNISDNMFITSTTIVIYPSALHSRHSVVSTPTEVSVRALNFPSLEQTSRRENLLLAREI